MKYCFTNERAQEIFEDRELVKEEALNVKNAFEQQGNTSHEIEMSANIVTTDRTSDMYVLVMKEYLKIR